MKKQFLEIGKIVSVHGLKGDVKVQPWCDSPDFLADFDLLYLGKNGEKPIEIEKGRVQKNMALLKIKGVDDVDSANLLRGKILYMNRDDVILEEGSYFIQDLVGLSVVDADDETISYGEITEVSETGANDVYHIKNGEKIYLIPAIKEVVISTDIEGGVMKIRPLKGLFDDEN